MVWEYKREEPKQTEVKQAEGKMRCVIVDAREGQNKDGVPRIEVYVRPSGCNFKVMKSILKNEKFNTNMSRFFDAFPEIEDGNFNFIEWIGALGAAEFEVENGFSRVKWFLYPKAAAELPAFEGQRPEMQKVGLPFTEEEPADEDFPF